MIEIHLYGSLKKKIDLNASFAEDTILWLPYIEGEKIFQLLDRLDIKLNECGEIFSNGSISNPNSIIPKGARIGLFPTGMYLLCGGQHLKGHGFITKRPKNESDYY